MLSKCRACHAPILWVKSLAGKPISLDARPTPEGYILLHPGQVAEVLGSARVEHVRHLDGVRHQETPLFSCHFGTCPGKKGRRTRKQHVAAYRASFAPVARMPPQPVTLF